MRGDLRLSEVPVHVEPGQDRPALCTLPAPREAGGHLSCVAQESCSWELLAES